MGRLSCIRIAGIVYILLFVITFGYAATRADCTTKTWSFEQECRSVTGITAAIFWPLYWSWEMFDK